MNKLFLVLFTVFLVVSMGPASSVQIGEFQKEIGNISKYNDPDKLDKLGYLEKFKLCLKLPKLLKDAYEIVDEADSQALALQKDEVKQQNIKKNMNTFFAQKRALKEKHIKTTQDSSNNEIVINAPLAATTDADTLINMTKDLDKNLTIVSSTLLFGDGVYDLKEGDIVQLYVENKFIYANFLSQNTTQGHIMLRTYDRVVNMTVYKFQDSFTGLKLKSINGQAFSQRTILQENQNQAYENKKTEGEKLIKTAAAFEGIAGVLGFSPLILDIFTLVYKILKNPGSLTQLVGLLTSKVTGAVKKLWKGVLKVMLWFVVIFETISAILLMAAVILRTTGEKIKETAQQDKDYLERIYSHF